jgi:hypothetical protein
MSRPCPRGSLVHATGEYRRALRAGGGAGLWAGGGRGCGGGDCAGDANNVAEVVVFGRGEAKIGVAHAASEGTIAGPTCWCGRC